MHIICLHYYYYLCVCRWLGVWLPTGQDKGFTVPYRCAQTSVELPADCQRSAAVGHTRASKCVSCYVCQSQQRKFRWGGWRSSRVSWVFDGLIQMQDNVWCCSYSTVSTHFGKNNTSSHGKAFGMQIQFPTLEDF